MCIDPAKIECDVTFFFNRTTLTFKATPLMWHLERYGPSFIPAIFICQVLVEDFKDYTYHNHEQDSLSFSIAS